MSRFALAGQPQILQNLARDAVALRGRSREVTAQRGPLHPSATTRILSDACPGEGQNMGCEQGSDEAART